MSPAAAHAEPEARSASPTIRTHARAVRLRVERLRRRALGVRLADTSDSPDAGRARVLFAVASVASVVFGLLTQGRLFFGASMWAETGTNYYAASQLPTLRGRLTATDAGYLALPQRLVAEVGHLLGLPPSAYPYLFNGAALVGGAVLASVVCLPAFRALLRSDALRFLLALTFTMVPGWETRNFINVTYYVAVVALLLAALALVSDDDVPRWAWVLPVLLLTKPSVLSVLPALVLAAVVARRRFRLVAAASVAVALLQAVSLLRNAAAASSIREDSDGSLLGRVVRAVAYALGVLGRVATGAGNELSNPVRVIVGALLVAAVVALVLTLRSPALALVVVALPTVGLAMALNVVTFGVTFGSGLGVLDVARLDRRFIVAVFASLLVVAALASALAAPVRALVLARTAPSGPAAVAVGLLPALLFAAWFGAGGWFGYGRTANAELPFPLTGTSQWAELDTVLASGEATVCVPLDPYGWIYGRGCDFLSAPAPAGGNLEWVSLPVGPDGTSTVTVAAPSEVSGGASLLSLALLVRSADPEDVVQAEAVLSDGSGGTTVLAEQDVVERRGELFQFQAFPVVPVVGTEQVTLTFDSGVQVGVPVGAVAEAAYVLWMGRP